MRSNSTDTIPREADQTALSPGRRRLGGESAALRRLYFTLFVVSGACSLVYEIAWLRLSMANFGVTTPMISIVLSVFMAGLGLGSWGGGVLVRRFEGYSAARTLRRYALLELLIGLSGVVVVPLLDWGRLVSEQIQNAAGVGSLGMYLVAGAWVTFALLPWCTCMGATIPFVMAAMQESIGEDAQRSFSLLYLANVLGAVLGTALPALVLFEVLGFKRTLLLTALVNTVLAISVLLVSFAPSLKLGAREAARRLSHDHGPLPRPVKRLNLWLLFLTGFVSMALEIVWTRQFTPFLGTVVYAFALILGTYLLATSLGSQTYRAWDRSRFPLKAASAWIVVGLCALIPLFSSDPRMRLELRGAPGVVRTLLGVAPFSCVVGFLTPMLIDDWCAGDPRRGGKAYAVNVLGCILGPLVGGFCVLPVLGERWGTVLLAAPLFLLGLLVALYPSRFAGPAERSPGLLGRFAVAGTLALLIVVGTKSFSTIFPHREVRRDYTATVIATGEGMRKRLLVNGVGITQLTPITKMMAHLPLAFLSRPPRDGLVICFGMGTTFRSMMSWGIQTTAVELVPSVPALFGYFHADGPKLLESPLAHVVVDDGRRFLERSSGQYDAIAIDPPPPVEAAGSSLLYSREFYALAKKRLRPGGILQQWLPEGDEADPEGDAETQASVARALQDSFRYVWVFRSVEGRGFHFLASDQPFPSLNGGQLAARMPPSAVRDMLEWGPKATAAEQFDTVLSRELPIQQVIDEDPAVPALSDNRPVNEYFLLRRVLPQSWMHGAP